MANIVYHTFSASEVEDVIEYVERMDDSGDLCVAMCSVGEVDVRLVESLRKILDDRFLLVTKSTPLPIEIDYLTPLTLGVDRKATACGAVGRCRFENVLVVDAGSALTIDLVADARFVGGNISPGLGMRLRALHEFTARLPLIDLEEARKIDDETLGIDTATAISAGCVEGMLGEISLAIKNVWDKVTTIIFTGGDGELLAGRMESVLKRMGINGKWIEFCPDLLAEGLREIYRHHEYEK